MYEELKRALQDLETIAFEVEKLRLRCEREQEVKDIETPSEDLYIESEDGAIWQH